MHVLLSRGKKGGGGERKGGVSGTMDFHSLSIPLPKRKKKKIKKGKGGKDNGHNAGHFLSLSAFKREKKKGRKKGGGKKRERGVVNVPSILYSFFRGKKKRGKKEKKGGKGNKGKMSRPVLLSHREPREKRKGEKGVIMTPLAAASIPPTLLEKKEKGEGGRKRAVNFSAPNTNHHYPQKEKSGYKGLVQ